MASHQSEYASDPESKPAIQKQDHQKTKKEIVDNLLDGHNVPEWKNSEKKPGYRYRTLSPYFWEIMKPNGVIDTSTVNPEENGY